MDPLSIGADSATLQTQCEALAAFTKTLLAHGVGDHYHTLPRLADDVTNLWIVLSKINVVWSAHGSTLMEDSVSDWNPIHDTLMGTKLAVQGLIDEMEPVARAGDGGWMRKIFAQSVKMGWHEAAMATYGARVNRHLTALEAGLIMMRLVMEHREGKPTDQRMEFENLQQKIQALETASQSSKKPSLASPKENTEYQLERICIGRLLGAAKSTATHYSQSETQNQKRDEPAAEPRFPEPTPLHIAARAANLAEVKKLIESGAALSARCNSGQTPVYSAALSGDTAVVDYIIQQGGDFKTTTVEGWAPLHVAAADGHANVVKLLLSHGANPHIPTECGQTPIYIATTNGALEVIKTLVDSGINCSDPTGVKGWTPLNTAVAHGHLDIVKYLLSQRADPNIPQEDGWTPLHVATNMDATELVQLLLQAGANPAAQNKNGQTPSDLADLKKYRAIAQDLLDNGFKK